MLTSREKLVFLLIRAEHFSERCGWDGEQPHEGEFTSLTAPPIPETLLDTCGPNAASRQCCEKVDKLAAEHGSSMSTQSWGVRGVLGVGATERHKKWCPRSRRTFSRAGGLGHLLIRVHKEYTKNKGASNDHRNGSHEKISVFTTHRSLPSCTP